jgi:hypothetical protein
VLRGSGEEGRGGEERRGEERGGGERRGEEGERLMRCVWRGERIRDI